MSYIDIVSGGTRAAEDLIEIEALADYGYAIQVAEDIFDPASDVLADAVGGRHSLFVLSPSIDRLYGARIRAYLAARLDPAVTRMHVCPSGEHNKTLDSVVSLCEAARAAAMDRDGLFVAVGGGIVLDMVGFAASIYRRGTKYIKLPTTLVGQVDVAVGVKTGVNAFRSKNILGNYYPAYATINDPKFLKTLPERELRCGMAEVIKMALVADADLFDRIEAGLGNGGPIDFSGWDYGIYYQAMLRMAQELQPNLLEADLERIVDFGHTFSMRFEIDSDHQVLHGEAVAIDMALSCCVARVLGLLSAHDCDRAVAMIRRAGLDIWDPALCRVEGLRRSIGEVQLHRKAVNLVLPTAIGQATFVKQAETLSADVLQAAIDQLADYAGGHG